MSLPGFTAEVSLIGGGNYNGIWTDEQIVPIIQPALPCIYGNWCGPGCGGGPVKDDVDGCCKTHDECYDRRGYFCCACDLQLLSCVCPKANIFTAKGRAAAAICAFFANQVRSGICNPVC